MDNVYYISGDPVSWAAHAGFGRKSFNPRQREKAAAQWELKLQHAGRPFYKGPLHVDFIFEMPIPKSKEKKILAQVRRGAKIYHTCRKDRTNLLKYAEDCLKGILIEDDNVICCGSVEKYYSENPRTIIRIQELHEEEIFMSSINFLNQSFKNPTF